MRTQLAQRPRVLRAELVMGRLNRLCAREQQLSLVRLTQCQVAIRQRDLRVGPNVRDTVSNTDSKSRFVPIVGDRFGWITNSPALES